MMCGSMQGFSREKSKLIISIWAVVGLGVIQKLWGHLGVDDFGYLLIGADDFVNTFSQSDIMLEHLAEMFHF